MNLSCVICAELFTPADDVHITPCGHMFHNSCLLKWLERSKTCPQCRNKCLTKSVHKVYFNLANLDTSRIDVGSLQQQLEDVQLQKNIEAKDHEKSKKEIEKLKSIQKKSMDTICALENKIDSYKVVVTQYSEQIKIHKEENKVAEQQRKEIKELKQQLDLMSTVQSILTSTGLEVEKILKENNTRETLATWVITLKRELRASENKRSDSRNMLKVVQHDLRKEREAKRALEGKISILESENYRLNSKVKQLESNNDSESLSISNSSPSIISTDSSRLSELSKNNEGPSPGTYLRVKKIEESNSPYLNIKSSSIGLSPMLKISDRFRDNHSSGERLNNFKRLKPTRDTDGILKKHVSADFAEMNNKYSIFKKPRLLTSTVNNPTLVFDGFGGSERKLSISKKDEDLKRVNDLMKANAASNIRKQQLLIENLRNIPSISKAKENPKNERPAKLNKKILSEKEYTSFSIDSDS